MAPSFGAVLALRLGSAGAASCLSDAIPVDARKPLKGPAGTYALGMWVNDWAAGHVVAEAMAILIEEMMGYLLEMKGPGPGTQDAFFALTGCCNPTNSEDRQCEGVDHTRVHVNVEGWTLAYAETWNKIQEDYTALAPRNLGNSGYYGQEGAYLFSGLKDKVFEATGISLDFYREYNASWKDLSPYFTRLDAVDTSRLRPCNDTNLMDSTEMQLYVDATGDLAGVTREGGKVFGKCWQNHFWVPPACRNNVSRCFSFFTGGSGWNLNGFMQKATVNNMAMAIAVGSSWDNYASLPLDYDSLFYSWVPDTTFLRKSPGRVVFSEFDALAWSRGDRSSSARSISIDTHVSQDLRALAPHVEELLSTYQFSLKDVNHMMLDNMDTVNSTPREAACRWLKGNRQRWQDWLPDKTKCFRGFGMFDEFAVGFGFVKNRIDPTGIVCEPCPSGYFSEHYQDDKGITFVCTACPPGTSQPFGASVGCDLCPSGEHQPESGSKSCIRCGISTYQDEKGQHACKQCPEGTSTPGQGSVSSMECGCAAGSINVANATLETGAEDQFLCQVCGEGMECPFHSCLDGLTQGVSPIGQSVPEILDGYVSKTTKPLQVFKCIPPSNCLRGKPGQCAGGLEDDLCTRCAAEQTWDGETCSKCDIGVKIGWCVAAALALMGIFVAYSFVNSPSTARANGFQLFQMALGLAARAAQSVAVFGLMAVSWPKSFTDVSSGFQIFILDLSTSSLTCLTGWNNLVRFTVSVMAFPVAALCLLMWWALTRSLRQNRYLKPWNFPYTFNTIGVFLPAGFASVCAIALQPMMCYSHPNGLQSILKFPSTFCGNDEHMVMLAMGIVLLFFVLGFLVLCIIAAWKLPSWSLAQEVKKVQAFRFLTGKFRVDLWWFGVLLLIRGFGFSIVIVIATDVQRAQATLVTAILMAYLGLQSRFWPWKARSINVAEVSLNALLVILINQSSQEPSQIEQNFAGEMAIAIMAAMVFCISCLLILNVMAFTHDLVVAIPLLIDHRPEKLSKALKDCAEKLSQIEQDDLRGDLGACNHYDLQALERAIAIISSEMIKDGHWVHFQLRMSASTLKKKRQVDETLCAVKTELAQGAVADVAEVTGVVDVENAEDDTTGSFKEASDSTSPEIEQVIFVKTSL